MPLTNNQYNTLRATIIADPVAGPMRIAGDTVSLLAWCNGASAALAWKTAVLPQASDLTVDYSTYDGLAAGKRDSWAIFLKFDRDFSMNRTRKWVTDVWGAAQAGTNGEAILQGATEFATRAQNAIGGTVKATGTVSALDRSFVGLVSQEEVNRLVST